MYSKYYPTVNFPFEIQFTYLYPNFFQLKECNEQKFQKRGVLALKWSEATYFAIEFGKYQ